MEPPLPGIEHGESLALTQEFHWIRFAGWLVIVAVCILFSFSWSWLQSGQWLIQSGILWWFVTRQIKHRLHLNRPTSAAGSFASLGWANRLTIVRGALIAMTGGFLFQDWPGGLMAWMPAIFYTVAAILDRLDGYVARKTAHTSLLGSELDTVFDALGLAIAPLLAVWYGQVHWSYLLVGCAYYLFQWGMSYRLRRDLTVHQLAPSLSRRAVAGFQMGYIAVVLYPVFKPPATMVIGVAFMLPLLAGFLVDWLTVTGKLSAVAPRQARLMEKCRRCSHNIIKPGLRLAIACTLLVMWNNAETSLFVDGQEPLQHPLMRPGLLLTLAMIVPGILPRTAAVLLVCLLGWFFLYHAIFITDYILLFSTVWLILSGGGRFSLWQWDDRWVNRYDGGS